MEENNKQDLFSLNEKVIVVTGGTGILGASFVNILAQYGASVIILGRNKKVADERVAHIISLGGKASAAICDVLDTESLEKAKAVILAKYGAIHGLVNAAGGNMPGGILDPKESVFNLSMDGLKQVLELNLIGTILPTQIFGAEIAKNASGSIVNISSMASQQAITKVLGYSLAKAGIEIYTKWFAVELANRYGDKVRMNAIAPGFFLTEQNRDLLTNPDGTYKERGKLVVQNTPFKRFGTPNELSGALVYLLSDASKFVNGSVLTVDGGFSIFSGV